MKIFAHNLFFIYTKTLHQKFLILYFDYAVSVIIIKYNKKVKIIQLSRCTNIFI